MTKLFLSILIILSLTNILYAQNKEESPEWNEIKQTTSKIINKSKVFSSHVLRDTKETLDELNENEEVKDLKNKASKYYDRISKDTSNLIQDIKKSEAASEIREKSKEIWKSIFGEKPKGSD